MNGRCFSLLLVLSSTSACLLLTLSCGRSKSRQDAQNQLVATPPTIAAPSRVPPTPAGPSCEQRIREITSHPALPGAPVLEAARTRILMRAKGEPVVFRTVPKITEDPQNTGHARQLNSNRYAYDILASLIGSFAAMPAKFRDIVLREGYVYAETPALAIALTEQLRAEQLFSEERFWVQRGAQLMHAVRTPKGKYAWEDGPERRRPVRLVLYDRLGLGEAPPAALHVDLRGLLHRLHFERARVQYVGEQYLVAELRYASRWITSLLRVQDARLELECEVVPSEFQSELWTLRQTREQAERAQQAVRAAIVAQIDEALPFDEPKTEEGQQDGHLRPAWYNAYLQGRRLYQFGPDDYPVFDAEGRPLSPQVCTDFLVDTLERASGTYFQPRGQPPQRVIGKLNLAEFGELRSAASFIAFTEAHPEWFEVISLPPNQHIEFAREQALHNFLLSDAANFAAGDLVIIRGWAPWDEEEMHYHSFFIYDIDPVSGLPLLLAGNPGRPSLRVWYTEMLRTPRRSIRVHIRPRSEWLSSIVADNAPRADTPPPIVGGPLGT